MIGSVVYENENSNDDSMSCFDRQLDELDAYRIRLEQQKMFLLLTSGIDENQKEINENNKGKKKIIYTIKAIKPITHFNFFLSSVQIKQ